MSAGTWPRVRARTSSPCVAARLVTPPTCDGILEGITRDSVMEIATSLGLDVSERTLTRSDLVLSDELFFTGTAAEIVPIREVDDHFISEPGPVTRRIQDKFHAIVGGRDDEFAHYMEAVEG